MKAKVILAGIVGLVVLSLAGVYGAGAVNTALANQEQQRAYVKKCLLFHSEKSCLEFWRYGASSGFYYDARPRS